jgi:hypothetical protein
VVRRTMSRNLIVYKVEYRLNSDPWDRDKFIKTKRIVMPLSEYDDSGCRYHNHTWIKKEFRKQMENNDSYGNSRYSIWRINKA